MEPVRELLPAAGCSTPRDPRPGGRETALRARGVHRVPYRDAHRRPDDEEAINAGRPSPGSAGTFVRDGYTGYEHLTDALHAWCGAHGLRDLPGCTASTPTARSGPGPWPTCSSTPTPAHRRRTRRPGQPQRRHLAKASTAGPRAPSPRASLMTPADQPDRQGPPHPGPPVPRPRGHDPPLSPPTWPVDSLQITANGTSARSRCSRRTSGGPGAPCSDWPTSRSKSSPPFHPLANGALDAPSMPPTPAPSPTAPGSPPATAPPWRRERTRRPPTPTRTASAPRVSGQSRASADERPIQAE